MIAFGCFLLLLPRLDAYEEQIQSKGISTEQFHIVVDERNAYAPLGHNAQFPCHVKQLAKHLTRRQPRWQLTYWDESIQANSVWKVPKMGQMGNSDRFRIGKDDILYGFGLQHVHDGIVLECIQEAVSSGAPGSSQNSTFLVSRTILVIQDCSTKDDSMDKRNPCRYGLCETNKSASMERIECKCMPQYTGTYCDVPVPGVFGRELIFFSPVATLFTMLLVFAVCHSCLEKRSTTRPLRFERHVPCGDRSVRLDSLYRAAYLTAAQVEAMTQDADDCDVTAVESKRELRLDRKPLPVETKSPASQLFSAREPTPSGRKNKTPSVSSDQLITPEVQASKIQKLRSRTLSTLSLDVSSRQSNQVPAPPPSQKDKGKESEQATGNESKFGIELADKLKLLVEKKDNRWDREGVSARAKASAFNQAANTAEKHSSPKGVLPSSCRKEVQ